MNKNIKKAVKKVVGKASKAYDEVKKSGAKMYDFKEGNFEKRTPEELAEVIVRGSKAYLMSCIASGVAPSGEGLAIYKSGLMTGFIGTGYSCADWDNALAIADKKIMGMTKAK